MQLLSLSQLAPVLHRQLLHLEVRILTDMYMRICKYKKLSTLKDWCICDKYTLKRAITACETVCLTLVEASAISLDVFAESPRRSSFSALITLTALFSEAEVLVVSLDAACNRCSREAIWAFFAFSTSYISIKRHVHTYA